MRTKKGIIVSTKMAKTLVVQVDTYKTDPKYQKRYKQSKKFYVHVENDENTFEEGQTITIAEALPTSKRKRWKVLQTLES